MQTQPLHINVSSHNFDHIMVQGETLGAIATLTFTDTKTSEKLCSAILLPADTELSLAYDEHSAAYPIYYDEGEVTVHFGFFVKNPDKILYATISCHSHTGEHKTKIHCLGRLQ